MPDLRTLNPPRNDLPSGPDDCYYARRERKVLPETY
jgi:hypothetical protein